MSIKIRSLRAWALAAGLSSVSLAGCGGIDGIELNGGIFDVMGIGSNSVRAKEPVVPQRSGLVLPPNRDVLPQPGSGGETAGVSNGQWPVDPEERKREQNVALKKQHDEYCAKTMQRKKALGDDTPTQGPAGRCDPSVLGLVGLGGDLR